MPWRLYWFTKTYSLKVHFSTTCATCWRTKEWVRATFSLAANKFKRNSLNQVKIYAGPSLSKHLTFGPPPAKSLKTEYGSLECTVEVVKGLREAVDHIHRFGSSHTETIVTENGRLDSSLFFFWSSSLNPHLTQERKPTGSSNQWTALACSTTPVRALPTDIVSDWVSRRFVR